MGCVQASEARRERIIVTGLPRSGTSWVAKAFSALPGFTYYREPDNYDHVAGAEPRFEFLYLKAGDDDPEYAAHMRRALDGQIATPFTLSEDPGPLLGRLPRKWRVAGRRVPALYMRNRDVLAKFVFANLTMDWLDAEYPDASFIHTVRHPCGIFASWQRNGWDPQPRKLLDQQRLVDDCLAPFASTIESADSFWERAGALWGAYYTVIGPQLRSHPRWVGVRHEWLCSDPVVNFAATFRRAGHDMPGATYAFLADSNRGGDEGAYSLTRSAASEIDKWKQAVAAEDAKTCRRVVDEFGLDLYPDFEPDTSPPEWLG